MDKGTVAASFIWKLLERVGAQLANLIIQIILARMIDPADFGVLAILSVFVNLASIFVQKGLSSSLIRKKNVDKEDFDTAFLAGMFFASIGYLVLFSAAPFLAEAYHMPKLRGGLRFISLSLFFGALYCVQNAILVRHMKFKETFLRGVACITLSGLLGIFMAVQGLGVWALAAQTVSGQLLLCLTAWNLTGWKPGLHFSVARFQEILSFGGKILLSELFSYGVESVRTLFIGACYSSEALSYYDRGQMYPATLMRGLYDAIGSVLLPVFSRIQDDRKAMAASFLQMTSFFMFLIMPLFVGFAAAAETLISLMLTETWAPTVPFVIIFCFAQLTQPVQGICRQVIYAFGKSNMILKIELVKDGISLLALLASLRINVYAIAASFFISMYAASLLMAAAAGKLMEIKFWEILRCIAPGAVYSGIMFVVVFAMNKIRMNLAMRLILQIGVGAAVYIGIAFLAGDKNIRQGLELMKRIKRDGLLK